MLEQLPDTEQLRQAGERALASGSSDLIQIIEQLELHGARTEAEVLRLRLDALLGDESVAQRVHSAILHCDGSPRAGLAELEWLLRLDRGEYEWAASRVGEVAGEGGDDVLALTAMARAACDQGRAEGEKWLQRAIAAGASPDSLRKRLELLCVHKAPGIGEHSIFEQEVEYADCDEEMGIWMEDSAGNRIKVALDTGTSGGMFTIHNRALGERLAGEVVLTQKNGIWYNYMPGPVDISVKLVSFAVPEIARIPVQYFDGRFACADGCFSPFAFPGLAITMDPISRRAWLRGREATDRYIASLRPGSFADVPYILRDGWIFVPVRVNGHGVLMMVETGSVNVNVNELTAWRYGLSTRGGTLEWNGKQYPATRADFTFELGSIRREMQGALVSDFVLGNMRYGLASAGDIGPEFLRSFAFTIDPFRRRLVLVEQ